MENRKLEIRNISPRSSKGGNDVHGLAIEAIKPNGNKPVQPDDITATILLIDDIQDNLVSIELLLTRFLPKCRVLLADTGLQGVDLAIAKQPDVVLLDVQMPEMDGIEVCNILKSNPDTANIPVIFLSGMKTKPVDKIKGLQEGGDAYLTKPVDAGELIAQVKVMLRIKHAEDALRKDKSILKEKVRERTLELQESWEKYHRIFENIRDVYYEILLDGTIVEISPSVKDISNYTREQLLGRSIFNLFSDTSGKTEFQSKIGKGKQVNDYELKLRNVNSEDIYCSINSKVVQDDKGNKKNIGSIRNVTQRKIAEDRLHDYKNHLEELVQKRTDEVKEKQAQLAHSGRLASLGEMSTGIAHELNQPLAIIRAQAEVLKTSSPDEEGFFDYLSDGIQLIMMEVDRAAEIIEHMRGFARKRIVYNEATQIVFPLQRSLVFFNEQFKNNDIELTTSIEEDLPCVNFNPQQFEQIVVNFLSNAQYAVNTRAEELQGKEYQRLIQLRVYSNLDTHSVVFEVEDNGIGMTPDEVDRCLEPFYTTKPVGQGTGLGLSIVHGIITDYKGSLSISSRKESGTIMQVTLPAIQSKG